VPPWHSWKTQIRLTLKGESCSPFWGLSPRSQLRNLYVRGWYRCDVYIRHSLVVGRERVCSSCARWSALIVRAVPRLASDPAMNVLILAVLSLAAGILLVAGLWTPIAGTSVALIEVCKMFLFPGDRWVWLLLGTAGAALAMLGPGLWSIDARLFGWKRIEAPPRKTNSSSF
jgi:hypothetical protein